MYLGLDLGTSGLRGLLVDRDGVAIGDAAHEYPVSNPAAGWSEQDPDAWVNAARSVIAALSSAHAGEMAGLNGIGVAGHMHGATLVDDQGEVLRPCILWNDTRAHSQAADLDSVKEFRALSGNIVFPGFTAPKLAWVRDHEPEVFARVAKVLLPKDYLVYWLTGRFVSEMSDAAGTSWLDTGKRAWAPSLLERSGMRLDQMPDLIEGSEVAGSILPARASELGLSDSVQIVGGGGDNAAAACGVGALSEGQGFVSLGTSGVLLAARDSYVPDPETAVHTFCHAIPSTWYQMGVILSATDSLNWLSGVLGKSPEELSKLVKPNGPSPVLFLPYLAGERTPHNDAAARGAFLGISRTTSDSDLAQAVMEGVAFALRDSLEALRQTGAKLDRVLAIGGGANSEAWVQICANILDMPLDLPAKGDFGAALGAARLAMVGVSGAAPSDIMTPPDIAKTVDPDSAQIDAYAKAYARYRAAYPAIKAISAQDTSA